MGITGLLPLLKKASTNCNVRRFSGCTVAIDAYCWLHKGAFGCAAQLGKGEPTTAYVTYCVKYINILLSHNIKPILVLDGRNLPSKSETEKKRRQKREENRKNAKEFLRKGMKKEAWECFTRCVDITPAMAREFIKVLRQMKIDYVVAPYEADAQLAYLARNNIVDIVITEDSDLVLFGCPKIFFKMSITGDGVLFDSSKVPKALGIKQTKYDFERFRWMCILSGCDYLASLPGIGLGRAKKLIEGTTSRDIRVILKAIPSIIPKIDVNVPESYITGFIQAERTFMFQLVFDTIKKKLLPLTPYTTEIDPKDLHFAGEYVDSKTALQMALGNIDLHSLRKVDDFDPSNPNSGYNHYTSIWSQQFTVPSVRREVTARDMKKETNHTSTIGMQATVSIPISIKKRRTSIETDSLKENTTDDLNLISIYNESTSADTCAATNIEPELRNLKRRRSNSSSHGQDNHTPDSEDKKPAPFLTKRRNPFLKAAKIDATNDSSSPSLKVKEQIEKDSNPVCLVEKNRIYNDDDTSSIIVKSQYFRDPPTANTKQKREKLNFDISISDEEDSIPAEVKEEDKSESQLSIYSLYNSETEEEDCHSISQLSYGHSSAPDSTVAEPGSDQEDNNDIDEDESESSFSLLKSPVLRSRIPVINRRTIKDSDDDDDKSTTSPGYSGNRSLRPRFGIGSKDSSPSTSSLNEFKPFNSKSPSLSSSCSITNTTNSFQSNRMLRSPKKIGACHRVGLSKQALRKDQKQKTIDPKQKTITAMFSRQEKAKL